MFSHWMTFLCLEVELLSSTWNLNTLFMFWDEKLKIEFKKCKRLLSTQECVEKINTNCPIERKHFSILFIVARVTDKNRRQPNCHAIIFSLLKYSNVF